MKRFSPVVVGGTDHAPPACAEVELDVSSAPGFVQEFDTLAFDHVWARGLAEAFARGTGLLIRRKPGVWAAETLRDHGLACFRTRPRGEKAASRFDPYIHEYLASHPDVENVFDLTFTSKPPVELGTYAIKVIDPNQRFAWIDVDLMPDLWLSAADVQEEWEAALAEAADDRGAFCPPA